MSSAKMSARPIVAAMVMMVWKTVAASSTPFVTQVAGPGQPHDELKASESKAIDGFMEDIGFSSFFQDVGVEAAASSPSFTKVLPAASNHFPSVGSFNFNLGDQTKEQLAAMKEQGFMPTNPFGSSSNLASSNIAPPDTFKNDQNPFGGGSGFKFPAFQTDFGFSGGFGSLGGDGSHAPVAKEEQKERPAASDVAVEHRPRGKSASSYRPRYAERRKDTFADDPYQGSRLYASPSKKEEKKNKGKCEEVHKDGMTCEICNDGHGGFSEHCSHSQNSGKDSKFTNTRRHTSDDVLKPKEKAPAPAPAYQQSQQRRVQQKQKPQHGGAAAGGRSDHPSDPHSAFDFSVPSFGSSPYAQSRQDNVYNKASDPFEGFGSDPFDHFAEGSNTDPYKFEIPEFDESEFNFGPDDHKKLVKKVGLHDEPKQTSNTKTTRVQPAQPRKQSGSQQNRVAEKNLGYKEPNPQENYKQLGKMVDQFGKKNRSHCKKEIRKSMTCYICPNPHGKTDEECMFASKDPHSQHMMYTEESSYGNPSA